MTASTTKLLFSVRSVRYFACTGTTVAVKQWSVVQTIGDRGGSGARRVGMLDGCVTKHEGVHGAAHFKHNWQESHSVRLSASKLRFEAHVVTCFRLVIIYTQLKW